MKLTLERSSASGSQHPCIASFPCGPPKNLENAKFSISGHGSKSTLCLKNADGVVFQGHIDPLSFSTYGIVACDRTAGKLTLSPAQGIFELRRVVDEMDNHNDFVEDIPADASHADQKRRLFEEFGSKKKKQTLRAADRNRIDIDKAGSAAAMDLAVRSGQKAAEKEAQAPTKHILPSYDLNATDPDKIYELSSIVSDDEAQQMDTTQLLEMASQRSVLEANKFNYSSFAVFCLRSLKKRHLDADQMHHLALALLYNEYLIFLFQAGARRLCDVSEVVTRVGCPEIVAEALLARFRQRKAQAQHYSLTKSTRSRLLCHICVLALKVFGQHLPKRAVTKLSLDLKISPTELFSFFVHVGATVKASASADDDVAASLRAPLRLPDVKRKSAPTRK